MRIRYILCLLGLFLCLQRTMADVIPSDTTTQSPCIGTWVVLQAQTAGDSYSWTKDGQPLPDATRSIVVRAQDTSEYVCDVLTTTISVLYNMMTNGDFETRTSFRSDYTYVQNTTNSDYYVTPGHLNNNLYTLTGNSNTFWRDYAVVRPHGGNYFGLFDTGGPGDAWRAETNNGNPNLTIDKDSVYFFSYWAANPNTPSYDNNPARLQFYIAYFNPLTNQRDSFNLGSPYTIQRGNNSWHQQSVTWQAPVSSTNVAVGVKNLESATSGNDFCLDDIMFQKTSSSVKETIHRSVFYVNAYDCNPSLPCPEPVTDSLAKEVFDNALPFVWRGQNLFAAGIYRDTLRSRDCDSIYYVLKLDILPYVEEPCVGVEQYSKWTDVIFIPDPDDIYVSYQWFHDGLILAGETGQYYYAPAGLSGTYHALMQTKTGTQVQSCPAEFDDLQRSAELNPGDKTAELLVQRVYIVSDRFRIVQTIYSDGTIRLEKQIMR